MTQSSMTDRVLEVIQACEAEWKQSLQAAEERIRELEAEKESLQEQTPEQPSILDEITDSALRKRLEPFQSLESLPLDTLIREAGVVLEDRLRTASGLSGHFGERLVSEAFKPKGGHLEFSTHPAEQTGVMLLYSGAMKFIRNPPMHKLIEYPETTARILIRLIDSLLLLLSEREPSQAKDYSLEERYNYIRDSQTRELAKDAVQRIQAWDPESVIVTPTSGYISLWVAGRRFATVTPSLGHFNIHTDDAEGNWTMYRIDHESHLATLLPLVRSNFERCLPAHRRDQILVAKKERSAEPRWDEASFLHDLGKRKGTEQVAVAQKILDWMKATKLAIRWGRGKGVGTFYLAMRNASGQSIFGLWSNGYVELHQQYLKRFPPFDDESKRAEWLARLDAIPGVRVVDTETGKFPHFPLVPLTDDKALQAFFEAADWVLEEISRASGEGRS
jgi:hypothetical protein